MVPPEAPKPPEPLAPVEEETLPATTDPAEPPQPTAQPADEVPEPDAAPVQPPPEASPPPEAAPRATPPPTRDTEPFSGSRSFGHLEALAGIGPRVAGSEGSREARAYLTRELEAIGAEVREHRYQLEPTGDGEPLELVHLIGVLPGESDDVFLLGAHYDTYPSESFPFVGANDGASGPALLLELGRVMSGKPRAYTIWLAFLDGDALPAVAKGNPSGHSGSELFADEMQKAGRLGQIRLGLFFNQVADPDLRIARDLRSNRTYRELIWETAADLGLEKAFPTGVGFETPDSSHRAFLDRKVRRVVAIVDTAYGDDVPPGIYWRTEDDDVEHCSAESLETVGRVVAESLSRIEARLLKIDRFARP